MKNFSRFWTIAPAFEALVHETARDDAMCKLRHASFIASHLTGGLLALCVFPVYLAFVGKPDAIAAIAFLWFVIPIGIALFLSKTGRFAVAHLLSAINMAGLVTFAAALTGGVASFLIAWMIAAPAEASMSGSRKVVVASIFMACAALAGLHWAGLAGLLPAPRVLSVDPAMLVLIGIMSAVLYVGGLATMVQKLHSQSEDMIRAGERRYRLLAENATDMITRHNRNGQVSFVSPACRQMLAIPPEEVMQDGLFNRVHVADRPAYLTVFSRAMENGAPESVEFRVRHGTGSRGAAQSPGYRWVEMRCKPVDIDAGSTEPREIVAVTRDISDRKTQELALLKARDEAEKANEAKSRFLANMSHELRTPLNSVIGFSEILGQELKEKSGEPRHSEYAGLIHDSGIHLLNVVNDVLDMSKIEAGKYEIVTELFDLPELVRSCCRTISHAAAEKGIELNCEIRSDLPEFTADKRACKQILLNLLSNAVKFSRSGDRVVVGASPGRDTIDISVKDTGIGISKKDLPRLGDPFVQANSSYDREHDGTGLGLSVVKGLVNLHGGSLEIESELGIGTTVTIRLPFGRDVTNPGDAGEPVARLLSA